MVHFEEINMSERFAKKWESKRDGTSFIDNVRGSVVPQQPLKPRLNFAVRKLDLQITRLDQAGERFSQKGIFLFVDIAPRKFLKIFANSARSES